jgi:hypothetical protein
LIEKVYSILRGEAILESKEDIFEINFIECPYCECKFSSQIDLESHLEAFGTNKFEHIRKLDDEHKKVDRTYVKGSLSKGSRSSSISNRKSRFYRY